MQVQVDDILNLVIVTLLTNVKYYKVKYLRQDRVTQVSKLLEEFGKSELVKHCTKKTSKTGKARKSAC